MVKEKAASKLTKKDFLQMLIIGLVILLIRVFLFTPLRVEGISMMPTLETGQRLWAVKMSKIQRFDIISFHSPVEPEKTYIKRVIGLPGDKVEYQGDQLLINGEALAEPYLDKYKKNLKQGELLTADYSLKKHLKIDEIPAESYFVLGDNRQHSFDGNEFGLIKKSDITGEAKVRYWPFKSFGKID